ncbi:hypothetical protein [Natrinema soli]|uniref:Blue (type 1) copper domain-containing protein n=1 Tax=Natrinema soli TaxID=1930624 RepID=A0ABD5SK89_9EURY|nr:hypothetical protein [Natrinema soli]
MLMLTGVATSTAFVAGCGGGGGGNGGNGGNGGGGNGYEIEPGTELDFGGQTQYWEGLAPSQIEGEQNPTLILQEGEDYTIGWSEGDGQAHNLEIRNDSGEVIDDLTTGEPASTPDDQENNPFQFTASSEMAVYRCQPHPQMEGELQIQGGGGGGNETGGNETGGNETGGNETEGGNETG